MNRRENVTVPYELAPVLFMIFVIFFTLKMTETVVWSWWIVTLPLWIIPVIIVGVVICAIFMAVFAFLVSLMF